MTPAITVGSRVAFHGTWPWHTYYGRVIAQGVDSSFNLKGTPSWRVQWEGDRLDPQRAGKESWVAKYVAPEKFHAVSEEEGR